VKREAGNEVINDGLEEAHGRLFDEQRRRSAVMDMACCTHPGTEYGAVRGLLMVRVLRFVRDRLSGSESADDQQTED
jgi:hypothetical protein